MHFEIIKNDFFVIFLILHLKKIFWKIIPAYITILEMCDYTVCDVTNPKMTIIE